ncbi:IS3 family transposase, partial [Burkholderia ambifaria]|uniref:IS3 family transposase n=1 Tax=Burkholderia ambifaria TaxID=152480 RepID=UPI001FC8707D
YDNAPIESFWGTLKNELVYHQRFATREQARLAITEALLHKSGGQAATDVYVQQSVRPPVNDSGSCVDSR